MVESEKKLEVPTSTKAEPNYILVRVQYELLFNRKLSTEAITNTGGLTGNACRKGFANSKRPPSAASCAAAWVWSVRPSVTWRITSKRAIPTCRRLVFSE